MKVCYYALVSMAVGDRIAQVGDLIPEATTWNFLPGYVAEGKIAPVLVSTLPEEDQEALSLWVPGTNFGEVHAIVVGAGADDTSDGGEQGAEETPSSEAPAADPDDEDDDDGEEVESYEDFTVAELKAELDARDIAHAATAKKADLIALLEADDAATDDDE